MTKLDKMVLRSKISIIIDKTLYFIIVVLFLSLINFGVIKFYRFELLENNDPAQSIIIYILCLLMISPIIFLVIYNLNNIIMRNGPGNLLLKDAKSIVEDIVIITLGKDVRNRASLNDIVSDISRLNKKIKNIRNVKYINADIIILYLSNYADFNSYCMIYAALNFHEVLIGDKKFNTRKLVNELYEDEYKIDTYPLIFLIDMYIAKLDDSIDRISYYKYAIGDYIQNKFYILHRKEVDQMSYNLIRHYRDLKERHNEILEYGYEKMVNMNKLPGEDKGEL